MVTIVQPPFWVPRPADTSVWVGGPKSSAVLSQLLTVGGQIPSRLPWNFGAFNDNPPVWSGGPIDSILLANLLTAAGQVKSRWPWNFTYDDPSIWTGTPTHNPQLTPSLGQTFPRKPWAFDLIDDPPVWSGSPLKSAVLLGLLTLGGQAPPRLSWNFGLDDPPVWQFVGNINQSLLKSLVISSPFFNPPWTFGRDDSSIWVGMPTRSAVLANLLTAQGQVSPRIPWNFTLDEPPPWYGQPLPLGERNLSLLTTQVGTPIFNQPFAFGIDYSSFWMGGPTPAYTIYLPPPPPFSLGGDWLVLARRRFRR